MKADVLWGWKSLSWFIFRLWHSVDVFVEKEVLDIFFDYGWLGVLINKNVALLDKTETYTMYVEFNLWEIASFNSLKLPPAQVLSCKSFSHK